MTFRVLMFGNYDEVGSHIEPQWWLNYVHKLPLNLSVPEINEDLSKYNAKFVLQNDTIPYGNRYLDFPDEKSYTMFVLRWS